jgi:hypothetical protein
LAGGNGAVEPARVRRREDPNDQELGGEYLFVPGLRALDGIIEQRF